MPHRSPDESLTGPTLPQPPFPAARFLLPVAIAALGLILFGIKLLVIGTYGNATPYWDQWDAEAARLYAPLLEGRLGWADFFLVAQNEHRSLTSWLLSLGLLLANGVWNPLLQMVVNAALHVGTICLLAALLTRVVGRRFEATILAFVFLLFGCPFGWENTLVGFQSCFPFVLLFSIGSLWLVTTAAPFTARWWAGVGLSVCGFFSMASGALAPAALTAVGTLQALLGVRTTRRHLASLVFLGALFVLGVALTPDVPHHAVLKAKTLSQLLHAWTTILAWPVNVPLLGPLLRNAPAALLAAFMLRTRPPAGDLRWFLLTLVILMGGQGLILAYGRATEPLTNRYLDLFAIDVLVNFACLVCVVEAWTAPRRLAAPAAVLWTVAVLASLGVVVHRHCRGGMEYRLRTARAQELHTRAYVRTGESHHLTDKPLHDVPFYKPELLAQILDRPSVRSILPSNLGCPLPGELRDDQPSGTCTMNGHGPAVPVQPTPTWGTYGPQGAATTGLASIAFPAAHRGYRVEIPVAGLPQAEGISLEIEQDGRRRPLVASGASEAAWGLATVTVDGRPFTLHLTDSSPEAWLAVGSPVAVGRWDHAVRRLLGEWDLLVIAGSITAMGVVMSVGLARGTAGPGQIASEAPPRGERATHTS